MKPYLLVEVKRGGITERQHYGFVIGVDKFENVFFRQGDDENQKCWLRSAAKPFQASLIIKSGAYQKFNFTPQELAVCCASHSGTIEHVKHVKSMLDKIGLCESDLQCGIREPLDKETRDSLIVNSIPFSQFHNNCSGKHAGMLAVCVVNNWEIKNYLDFNHPLQIEITKIIAEFCNYPEKELELGRDGCSAPVHALPFTKMGTGFINLFSDKKYEILKKAIQANPILAGGKERLDTEIIMATSGRLISKVGAEGLCVTVNTEKEQALVVKIIDGDMKARSIATIKALKQLKWLSDTETESLKLSSYCDVMQTISY